MGGESGLYSPPLLLGRIKYMYQKSILSTVHSSPQAAILFSHLANIISMTNMPSTNDTKNMFLEILLAPNIVHSKDNEIARKHSQN